MSDPIALVQVAYEAFNRHDTEMLVALCHPEMEFVSSLAAVEGAYRGHDGVRRYMEDIQAAFGPEWRAEAERMESLDDGRVLVVARVHGHGAGGGVPLEHRLAHIWQTKDGKLYRGIVYLNPEEAIEAA